MKLLIVLHAQMVIIALEPSIQTHQVNVVLVITATIIQLLQLKMLLILDIMRLQDQLLKLNVQLELIILSMLSLHA
jgi:hypothetical protein